MRAARQWSKQHFTGLSIYNVQRMILLQYSKWGVEPREVKELARSHTAKRRLSLDSNLGCPDLEMMQLITLQRQLLPILLPR